jgi:hypothetical protein
MPSQPAKISKKIYHFYIVIQKQIARHVCPDVVHGTSWYIAVKVLHTSLLNITVVAFKVLPLGSYAPMPVHPAKQFWNWFCGMAFRAAVALLLMSSNRLPFSIFFIFGNRKKPLGARLGEYGGCSSTVICLLAKNSPHRQCCVSRSFGTIFAHTFLMSRSSVKISLTVSLSMFTSSAMLLTVS